MVRSEFKHAGLGIELPNLQDLKSFAAVITEKNRTRDMKEQFLKAKAGKITICETDNYEDRKEFEIGFHGNAVLCLSPDIGFIPTNEGLLVYAIKCTDLIKLSKMVPYKDITIVWMDI
jgi:hypothetical protein